jgi:hypothetical protein
MAIMEHLSRGREIGSARTISVATSVGKGSYVVYSISGCNIIKNDISGIICDGVELINVVQVRVQWRDFVNSVMNHHEEEEFVMG